MGGRVLDVLFCIIFTVELMLRILAENTRFVHVSNPSMKWNLFDSFVVFTTLAEEVFVAIPGLMLDMSAVRLLRMLRLVRIFRAARIVRYFKDLQDMVAGITNALTSLFWALLILFFITYIFAVMVLQVAAEEAAARSGSVGKSTLGDATYDELEKFYGSLMLTIFTLYKSVVGGIDWGDAAEPLVELSYFMGMAYCVYVAFSVLCVLNIFTAVCVENATKMPTEDSTRKTTRKTKRLEDELRPEARKIFEDADTDGAGFIDVDKFQVILQDHRVQAWLYEHGLDPTSQSPRYVFASTDVEGLGYISLDQFVTAIAMYRSVRPSRPDKVRRLARFIVPQRSGGRSLLSTGRNSRTRPINCSDR